MFLRLSFDIFSSCAVCCFTPCFTMMALHTSTQGLFYCSFALITQINKKLFFMGKTKCSEFPSLPFFHFIPLLTFQARLQDHKITKVEFLSSILYLQIDDWRKIRMGNTWRSNRTDSEKQHLYFRIHTWDPFVALFIGILSHGDNRSRIAQFWRTLKSHFLFFFMGFFCWSPRKPHF